MDTLYNLNIESMCALSALIELYRHEENDAIADCLEHASIVLELVNENIDANSCRETVLDISNSINI